MPTNLLLLPLLGGYWFIHTFQYTRFRSQRLDGYRLLVESALGGVILAMLGWLLLLGLRRNPWVQLEWKAVAPDMPFLGTACVSLILGVASPYVLNAFLNLTGILTRVGAQLRAIDRYGNQLLRLLHAASAQERMVSIVLDNRKVYIGSVAAAPNLEAHDVFVSLTPIFSGYRHKDTLDLVLTVDYLRVYEREQLDPDQFTVTLPIQQIRIASFFDHTVYPSFLIASPEGPTDEDELAEADSPPTDADRIDPAAPCSTLPPSGFTSPPAPPRSPERDSHPGRSASPSRSIGDLSGS